MLEVIPDALDVEAADLLKLGGRATKSGVVFVPWTKSKYGVVEIRKRLEQWYEDAGFEAPNIGVYSGGQSPVARAITAAQFQKDELAALVATKSFGMGIDKPNIRWTVHVGLPSSIEAFAQEAGRAGRDPTLHAHCVLVTGQGAEADITSLLDPDAGC